MYLQLFNHITSHQMTMTVKWMGCVRRRPWSNFNFLTLSFCLEGLGTPAITSVKTARISEVVPVNAEKATGGGSVPPPTDFGISPTIRPPPPWPLRRFGRSEKVFCPARESNYSSIIQLVAYLLHWAQNTQSLFYALIALLK